MRVLTSACPMYGYVNTVLPLALAMQRAGHDVVLATGPDHVGRVGRHGVTAWPVGPTHAEGTSVGEPGVTYFQETAVRRAEDLVPMALAWRPDLVVHEETELAGAAAAAATGARHVVHGLGLMPSMQIWAVLEPALDRLLRYWAGRRCRAAAVRDATDLTVCPPSLRPATEPIWRRVAPVRPDPGRPADGETLPDAVAALPTATFLPPPAPTPSTSPWARSSTTARGCSPTRSPGCATCRSTSSSRPAPAPTRRRCGVENADACRSAGAALTLLPGEVTAAAVRAAAARLLAEPGFTTAAAALRAELDAMPDADRVARGLIGSRAA